AGTLESSDVYVTVEPSKDVLEIEVDSVVYQQFGDAIRAAVASVLQEMGVTSGHVRLNDRGALECTIRARVETAVMRSGAEGGAAK
ncbi:MAG: citrate lyase acyl carrier protein, partial [Oscillospiraceae bacterium]